MASESINPNWLLENIEIDYVPEEIDFEDFEEFKGVFAKFNNNASASAFGSLEKDDLKKDDKAALAKNKGKKGRKMSVAELKKISSRPDVVDKSNATAADPKLLVYLKSYRNTVPVPGHWSQKKRYLQVGIEKQPYQLPDYVAATGIEKMREAYIEKGDSAFLNHEMNIDYQVFYDAFYENQTKPRLTTYGDLYYEGKEFEEIKEKEPVSIMSRELREALDLPDEGAPPPWVTNMQRHGSPPCPYLDIGASFDHHPGGSGERWGDFVD